MKKKITKSFFLFLSLSMSLVACKKGENDPLLSLKSRASRLAGEWELVEMNSNFSSSSANYTSSYIANFSNGIISETDTYTFNGSTTTDNMTGKYIETFTFDKNGTYEKHTEQYYQNGRKYIFHHEEGNWSFIGKNKNEELKSKEAIQLFTNSSSTTYYEDTPNNGIDDMNSFTEVSNFGEVLYIDRLTNKEIVFKLETNSSENNDGAIYSSKGTSTQTFKAK